MLARLLTIIGCLLLARPASASFTFVSSGTGGATGSATTLTMTAATVHIGDLVVVAVKWEGGDTTVTVGDTGSTFVETTAGHGTDASGGITSGFYSLNSAKSGTVTYTVTWSLARTFRDIGVIVYTPSATPTTDGTFNKNVGTGTTFTSGSITTTGTDGVAFGYYGETGGTPSSPLINGGAADQSKLFGSALHSEIWSKAYAAGFTGSATATISVGNNWGGGVMAFKITGGAVTPGCKNGLLLLGAGCED